MLRCGCCCLICFGRYIKWSDVDVVRLSDMLWEIYIKWPDVDVVVSYALGDIY